MGEHERSDGEIVERRRYVATFADSLENTAAMFGILAPDASAVDLGRVHLKTLQRLCDRKRLQEFKRRARREEKLRMLWPKRQQSLVDVGPDRGREALAL
ncbi:MAG: hypothetical protein ACT452_05210 [Microthrixaceae bacterium]